MCSVLWLILTHSSFLISFKIGSLSRIWSFWLWFCMFDACQRRWLNATGHILHEKRLNRLAAKISFGNFPHLKWSRVKQRKKKWLANCRFRHKQHSPRPNTHNLVYINTLKLIIKLYVGVSSFIAIEFLNHFFFAVVVEISPFHCGWLFLFRLRLSNSQSHFNSFSTLFFLLFWNGS